MSFIINPFISFSRIKLFSPILANLIASYSFEDTDTVFTDDLGKHHGTHEDSPDLVSGSTGNGRGYRGYASGTGGYSEVPYHADFKTLTATELTLMADFYPTAVGGSGTSNIAGLFETDLTGIHHYYLGHRANDHIRGRILTEDANPDDFETTGTVTHNQWNRVFLRWKNGETIKVTINGVTEVSPAIKTGTWNAEEWPFYINIDPANAGASSRSITGRVDNVMLWGRQLNDAEVTTLNTGNPAYDDLNKTEVQSFIEAVADNGIITNGGFDTDTWWTKANGSTISGGVATLISNGDVGSNPTNWCINTGDIDLPVNTRWVVRFRARQTVGTGELTVTLRYFNSPNERHFVTSEWADYEVIVPPHATYQNLVFGGWVVDDEFEIDDVTVTTITSAEEVIITDLINGLKANGTWDKYHAIYPMIGGTAHSHKFNLKNPQDLDGAFRLTFAGTVTHSANGVDPDGITGYANTHYNPTTSGTLNSSSLSYYSKENTTHDGTDIGVIDGTDHLLMNISWNGADHTFDSYNSTTGRIEGTSTSTDAYFQGSRLSSTDNKVYKNGVQVSGNTTSGGTLPNLDVYLFGANLDGTADYFQDRGCVFATIGLGLTATEVADDYTVIQAYQDTLNISRLYTVGTNEFDAMNSSAGMVGSLGTPNSSLEWEGLWWSGSTGTHGVESTITRTGNTSLKVTGTSGDDGVKSYDWNPTGEASGQTWNWQGYVYIPIGITKAELRISDNTAGPTTLDLLTSPHFVNDAWFWFSFDHTQEASNTFSMFILVNKPSSGTIYLDDMKWINIT